MFEVTPMRHVHPIVLSSLFVAVAFVYSLRANDALFVVDLVATNGQFVESAVIEVPAGFAVGYGFQTANRVARDAFYQGVKIEVPGLRFVTTDHPNYLPVPPSPFADAPRYTTNIGLSPQKPSLLVGPCKISAFASNSPARLQVYVVPQDPQLVSGYLIGTNTHVVTVRAEFAMTSRSTGRLVTKVAYPSGLVTDSDLDDYLPYTYTVTNSSGIIIDRGTNASDWISTVRGYAWPTPATQAKTPSSVISGFTLNRGKGLSPTDDVIGPATVSFSVAADDPYYGYSQQFGSYSYRILPVNVSYGGTLTNGSTNTSPLPPTNTPAPMGVFIERSTDMENWSQVDSFYVTETAGQAYYRVRAGSATASNQPTLGALKVSNGAPQNLADALSADNDPAGDGLSERAKYALRDFGTDWENPSVNSAPVLAAANAAGLFSRKQHNDQRTAGRGDVTSKPNEFSLFTQSQYSANRTMGRTDVTGNPTAYNLFTRGQYNANRTNGRTDVIRNPSAYSLIHRSNVPSIRIATKRGNRFSLSLLGSWTRYAQSGMLRGWTFDGKKGVLRGTMPQSGMPSVRLTPYRGSSPGAQVTIQFQPTAN